MKKRILSFGLCLIVVFTTLSLVLPVVSADIPEWTIDGDKVFIDDANVYLSATPHTLEGSGWVEFELNSKNYEGAIDVVWGFDTALGVIPRTPQIWAENAAHEMERWIDVPREGETTFQNVISFEILIPGSAEPDIGNLNNDKLIRLELETEDEDGGLYILPVVVAYNTVDQHSETSATFYYNYTSHEKEYYTEYYPDFRPFDASNFTRINYSYLGVDDYYHIRFASIEKNRTYKLRVWVDVPIRGTQDFTSKYVWGVKPANRTIREAREQGHLYLLDPWLSGGWDQRIKFTVDSGDIDANLVNFPVLFYLSASSSINSADLSFIFDELQNDGNRKKIAITTSDETTQCYVEIERWSHATTEAWGWFKAPFIASGVDTDFYLYYDIDHADNDAYVGDTNDVVAENVWDANYALVYHMADGVDNAHVYDSTSNDNDGTKEDANEPNQVAGHIAYAQDFDGGDDFINTNSAFQAVMRGSFTIELIATLDDGQPIAGGTSFGGGNFPTEDRLNLEVAAIPPAAGRFAGIYESNDVQGRAREAVASFSDGPQPAHQVVLSLDATVQGPNAMLLYFDSVSQGLSIAPDDGDTTGVNSALYTCAVNLYVGTYNRNGVTINHLAGLIDEVRLSTKVREPEWIKASYETCWDDLLTWGVEESVVITVDTNVAIIDNLTATLSGTLTITDINATDRGFVWDTVTHANPDDVAPPATYADSWTESGSFGTGLFSHEITELTELTTYYYRACAYNVALIWVYGDEKTFFIGEEGKVYVEFRPDLDETKIRGQAGIPSDIVRGIFNGYSLPITDHSDNETLNYIICVPSRWDGESDILVHIDCATTDVETGNAYEWHLEWQHYTPNEDIVPDLYHGLTYTREVYSLEAWQGYQDWIVIPYDLHALDDPPDLILKDDLIAITLSRNAVKAQNDTGEIAVFAVDILFARGDFLADPEGNVLIIVTEYVEEIMAALAASIDAIGIQFGVFNGILEGWSAYILLLIGLLICLGLAGLAYWKEDKRLFVAAGLAFILYGFAYFSISLWYSIILVLAGAFIFIRAFTKQKGI